jgi:hypothetical protein
MQARKGHTLATFEHALAFAQTGGGTLWVGCLGKISTSAVIHGARVELLAVFRTLTIVVCLGDTGIVFGSAPAVQLAGLIATAVLRRTNFAGP